MNVIINDDERSATDEKGRVLQIDGLIIITKEKRENFYSFDSRMCRLVCCRGHKSEARDIGNGKIHLL